MNLIYKNIDNIKEYENNPRNNEKAINAVKKSIKEFGFKVPIVIDKNDVIICGHTRYKASKELGINNIPCIIADDLTEEQINAFRLIDNKTQEYALWDFTKLAEELKEINDKDLMEIFGFNNKVIFDEVEYEKAVNFDDIDNADELLEGYEEPVYEMCKCPKCNHIDRKIHFKKIKVINNKSIKVDNYEIRYATLEDINKIKKIADKYSNELGFILRPVFEKDCEKKGLIVADKDNEILGFCHFNNRKDGITVIYEICVDYKYRGNHIAKAMIDKLNRPIRLKCPIDNKSNEFYKNIGCELVEVEKGKKRPLNVWSLK